MSTPIDAHETTGKQEAVQRVWNPLVLRNGLALMVFTVRIYNVLHGQRFARIRVKDR